MSMPIQRQSEQFAAFDTGTQWARDREIRELPKGLAGLVNSMSPRISAGMLNTRDAGMHFGAKPSVGGDGGSSTSGDYVDVPGLYDGSDHPSYFEPGGVGNESWDSWEPGPDLGGGKTAGALRDHHHVGGYGRSFSMGDSPYSAGWGPRDHGGAGPDGGPANPPHYEEDYDEGEDDEFFDSSYDPDRFISEDDIDPHTAAILRRAQSKPDDDEWSELPLREEDDEWAMPFDDDRERENKKESALRSGRHPFELTAGWADDNPAFDDVMKHIDDQLSAGEKDGEDYYFNDDYLDGPHPGSLPRPGGLWREHDELSPDAATHGRERYEGPEFAGATCDHCGVHHSEPFEVNDISVGDDHKGKFCDDCTHKLMPSWYGHTSSRLAGWADDNPDFDDVMKHIDEQLAAGEQGSDRQVFRDPRFNGDNGHRRDPNQELAERGFSTGPGDAMRVAWEGKACPDCAMAIANGDDSGASEGWSWDNMQSGINSLPGDGDVHLNCNEDDDCDSNFQRGPCDLCGNPDSGTFHPVVSLDYNHRNAAMAARIGHDRLAGWADDNPDYNDIMKHIDEQLAAGEDADNQPDIPHSGLTPRPPTRRERALRRQQEPFSPEEERRFQEEQEAFDAAGFSDDDNVFSDDYEDRPPTLRELFGYHTAAGEVVDPAAQQQMVVPPAGGLQPGHRIGLPWRGNTIRGTVIGLDGDNAAVRWDDGQYSSEEPRNIQLL